MTDDYTVPVLESDDLLDLAAHLEGKLDKPWLTEDYDG